jgi:O-antigen ligase
MLLSVLYVIFVPAYGVHQPSDWVAPFWAGHWRGIYTHKNTLGNTASIALLIFVVFSKSVIRSAAFRAATLIAVSACLFGAASITGVVVATIMISVAIAFKLLLNVQRETRVAVLGAVSFLSVVAIATAVPMFTIVLELLGKEPDLTGRVPIWSTLIVWAQDRPWLGFGFASFEEAIMPRFRALTGEPLVNAHNGYLETFISFGYLGVTNLVIVLVFFVRNVVILLRRPMLNEKLILPLAFSLFIGSVCSNITESFFLAYASMQHMSFAIAYMMIAVASSRATSVETAPKSPKRMQQSPFGTPSLLHRRRGRVAAPL